MDLQGSPALKLKPADKTVMVVIGLIIAAVIAVPVLTWTATVMGLLATIMENTVYFVLSAGALVLGGLSLWTNRTAIVYKWANISRNIRRKVVRENPLGTMDTAIRRFEKKLIAIDEHLVNADAARDRQHAAIAKLLKTAKDQDQLATQAQISGKTDREIGVYGVQADRCRESAEKLRPMAIKFDEVLTQLTQGKDVCLARLADMRNQRSVFQITWETMMSGNEAIKGFKAFFQSNEDLDMLQMSIDEIDLQTTQAEAEIDQFLYNIKPAIDAQQLKKDAESSAAVARIKGSAQQAAVKQLPSASSVLNLPTVTARQGVVVE